jgi:beta-lactamase superfamily II metal-dependent hydrolase
MKMNYVDAGLGGGSVLQSAGRSPIQMMSYLITTPNGRLMMIDGGYHCQEDADYLYELLKSRGGVVDYWFISHTHGDHYGALLWMLQNRPDFDIEIGTLCHHFPTREWQEKLPDHLTLTLMDVLEEKKLPQRVLWTGDVIECDGIRVEVLSHPEDYWDYPSANPTSVILKFYFPKREILFLGDFDRFGEAEFFAKRDASKLRCDIVQMSHHGQTGSTREFYERIAPKICLYPTPIWLWENNYYACFNPETRGKGIFTTPETRRWMEELGVELSCVDGFGDWLLQ